MTGGALDAHVVVRRRDLVVDIVIAAAPGEIVAIMGPSGAGKSTLLSAIAGLARLHAGSIRIDETDAATTAPRRLHVPAARRGVVMLSQDPHLFPHLTVRDNIAFGPRARGVERTVADAAADEWIWRVGLDGMGDVRPAALSGGQQQRVALARALATEPKLLLLDEPLTAIDAETAGDIRALLHDQLAATRVTTLLVSHDAVDAASLAARLVIVEEGRVAQEGPVREVLSIPATRFAAVAAGVNRVIGVARGGRWVSPDGEVVLAARSGRGTGRPAVADGEPLAALFRPAAVRLERPEELTWTAALRLRDVEPSPAGEWLARVVRLEQTPAGARVHTAEPAVAVDLAADDVAALGLAPGVPVRLRVAAADVRIAAVAASAVSPAVVPAEITRRPR